MEVQPVTPDEEQDEDDSMLAGIEIDVLIEALQAAMMWQNEAEQTKTIQIIQALQAAKIFA